MHLLSIDMHTSPSKYIPVLFIPSHLNSYKQSPVQSIQSTTHASLGRGRGRHPPINNMQQPDATVKREDENNSKMMLQMLPL